MFIHPDTDLFTIKNFKSTSHQQSVKIVSNGDRTPYQSIDHFVFYIDDTHQWQSSHLVGFSVLFPWLFGFHFPGHCSTTKCHFSVAFTETSILFVTVGMEFYDSSKAEQQQNQPQWHRFSDPPFRSKRHVDGTTGCLCASVYRKTKT